MTATEAALYDQQSGGQLRRKLPALTHQNLPLSIFLEIPDLGYPAWSGGTSGYQSNTDIINALGLGIVRYKEEEEPEGELEANDVEYRVDTDVITTVKLETEGRITPDNPASVTFHILDTEYVVEDVVIPENDSQLVWVKWHTPKKPQVVPIQVEVNGAYTAKNSINANIVDLSDKEPPDPLATDTSPGFRVPPLPAPEYPEKTTANWGIWSCHWEPKWVWHSDWVWIEDDWYVDRGYWEDRGDWAYDYTGYTTKLKGKMSLLLDDVVKSAEGKEMPSGYGVKTEVSTTLSTDAPDSHFTYAQTALSTFPEFQYETYSRLLERTSGGFNSIFQFRPNRFSIKERRVQFTPVWFPDHTKYEVFTQVWDVWTPDGMLSVNVSDYVEINRSVFDDWYTSRD